MLLSWLGYAVGKPVLLVHTREIVDLWRGSDIKEVWEASES